MEASGTWSQGVLYTKGLLQLLSSSVEAALANCFASSRKSTSVSDGGAGPSQSLAIHQQGIQKLCNESNELPGRRLRRCDKQITP